MDSVLFFDIETTGLDPATDEIIEVGYVLWSIKYRMMIESFSSLLPVQGTNGAEFINRIPVQEQVGDPEIVWALVEGAAERADAVIAHFAVFDKSFVEGMTTEPPTPCILGKPWICTTEDMEWPLARKGCSLVELALAYGVAAVSSHRSMHDCLLLARLFERVEHIDRRLESALKHSMLPRAWVIAQTPYEQKDLVKSAGFHWNGATWRRYMVVEEAEKLPFKVVLEEELSA